MNNPLITENTCEYKSVPFSKIKADHFMPALEYAVNESKNNIDLICKNSNQPTFDNTILAFENSSNLLDYVTTVYYHYFASIADDKIRSLVGKISELTSKYSNDIYLNEDLFNKIKNVYENKDLYNLDSHDLRLTDETYNAFIRSGANLSTNDKEEYRKLSQDLSRISPKYSNNVLSATNKINNYWIEDSKDLDGIPQNAIDLAKSNANKNGKPDFWCFTLDTNVGVLLSNCDSRSIREDVYRKFGSKCNGGEFDNSDNLKMISKLRDKKAKLLGYETHADFVLDRRMAKSKENVYKLIDDLIKPSHETALKEYNTLLDFAKKTDGLDILTPWDLPYYSNRYKKEFYNFDDESLRPYFKSENVINGVFDVANKLYGLNFEKLDTVDKFHDEVCVYKVTDLEDKYIGLLYQDIHPRSTKRGGAWMNQLRAQGLNGDTVDCPHVTFNCNLTKSTPDKPALLSLSEVRTIFHEFGHCLHGLLTNVKYKSLGGMSVYWDFVELPSQIFENWLLEPEVLNMFAFHYETGEVIPKEFIVKINELRTFMSGSMSLRQLQLCKIDMAWHDGYKEVDSVEEYENSILKDFKIVPQVKGNSISHAFSHIFSGGYSAGYYSYKWAELLEADAFDKFKKTGIFNKNTAEEFKNNILSKGNTDHPMNLYVGFRGREPKVDALLRKTGLTKS